MEFHEFFSFLVILKESIKLLPKNGNLMALIVIISVVLNSILFLSFNFSFKSLTNDMVGIFMNAFMPDPSSFVPNQSPFTPNTTSFMPDPTLLLGQGGRLREDFALLLAVQMAFIIGAFFISILSTTATVLVSAMSYNDMTLSLTNLCSRIVTRWKRALVTGFYTKLHAIGYLFLVVALAAPLLMSANKATISAAILLGISASFYFLYLAVVWILAVVVSVVDEYYGMEAIGKAATVIKSKRLHGFMLNIFFNLLGLIVVQGYRIILGEKGLLNLTIYGLFMMVFSSLGNLFLGVAYTVLYFQCKKIHGEEIELYGSIEYTKLPTTQPVNK
ncbi:hypothetical protein Adt_33978 [Abeliophyllum distichum]|uniref:Transmembrane protein n=1 Tax=Abeliophyllum distichum TaxID=126358 RepID=A0ABD1QZ47_9LAMI